MAQKESNTTTEAPKEEATKTEVKDTGTISQDQIKSLLDENNKKINEALEKQNKDLEKLLKITKEAKIEEIKEQEEQRPQIDPFDAYRMQKQKERDEYLLNQMNSTYSIESELYGKKENESLTEEEKVLVQHHQEVWFSNLLDRTIDKIKTNSKSVYMPFKEELETLREDLRNFNYIKIFMDYMGNNKEHEKIISQYVKPYEISKNLKINLNKLEKHHDALIKKIYSR